MTQDEFEALDERTQQYVIEREPWNLPSGGTVAYRPYTPWDNFVFSLVCAGAFLAAAGLIALFCIYWPTGG